MSQYDEWRATVKKSMEQRETVDEDDAKDKALLQVGLDALIDVAESLNTLAVTKR